MTVLSDSVTLAARKLPPPPAVALPKEVEFILSALEAGQFNGPSRREGRRWQYRVAASIKLFSDNAQAPPWTLYVRNVAVKALGFVTRHRLPLGYGGILTLPSPQGKRVTVDCTILRCREAVSGWFEGSVYFNREQALFDVSALNEIS